MSRQNPLPSAAELRRAEEAVAGGAKRLFYLHCESIENGERRLNEALELRRSQLQHLQRYQMLSVACGTMLGFASLVLCAFGIAQKADLAPLALVLGPVSAIAGVFVWGYRPKDPLTEVLPPSSETGIDASVESNIAA